MSPPESGLPGPPRVPSGWRFEVDTASFIPAQLFNMRRSLFRYHLFMSWDAVQEHLSRTPSSRCHRQISFLRSFPVLRWPEIHLIETLRLHTRISSISACNTNYRRTLFLKPPTWARAERICSVKSRSIRLVSRAREHRSPILSPVP